MIKPVTYQGVFNFKANLYALEVKSRFIDQSKADGYYKGYGDELAATVVGQSIQIGTGAFVVQGRMNEVTAAETVTPQMTNGYVGYVVARIETYHPSDEENCSFVAYVGTSLDAIPLTKDDIYDAEAETVNKVYETPDLFLCNIGRRDYKFAKTYRSGGRLCKDQPNCCLGTFNGRKPP